MCPHGTLLEDHWHHACATPYAGDPSAGLEMEYRVIVWDRRTKKGVVVHEGRDGEVEVAELLAAGWTCVGGVAVTSDDHGEIVQLAQALMRPAPAAVGVAHK